MLKYVLPFLVLISNVSVAQRTNLPQQLQLNELYSQLKAKEQKDSIRVQQLAKSGTVSVFEETEDQGIIALVSFQPNGFPVFYGTTNANASATVGTNLVVAGATNGYGLTGNGMVIGEWDGGSVRSTHQELIGRVSQIDSPSGLSDHSTHVAGTMIASGVVASAKGMATAATIHAHDFYSDGSEMVTFASNNNILSNHSYGLVTGWRFMGGTSWRWYGDTTISGVEDYSFGFYSYGARNWDLIANAAPNYLIVKSAGNDRNDVPPASVTTHQVWSSSAGSWVNSTTSRPSDGGTTGYDCISAYGVAKNILTVGAVSDITSGYSQPSNVVMSSFSGWGPTDDGRIKPDIVANGISLYSTGSSNNSDYYNSNGTSMSAPNATGSIALLQEMYNDSNNTFMRSSTLKALVIHTANEAGSNNGPDYSFGWGLLNIKGAADLIADTITNKIIEDSLATSTSNTYTFYSNGLQDIEATIVWNDPAAMPVTASLDPSNSMLVNDLDLRISNSTGTTKFPWILNPASPSSAATKADNFRDNVEKVIFDSPSAGMHTITVSHKSTLTGGGQYFSLIVSGVAPTPASPTVTASFTGTPTSICSGSSVQFTSTSTGSPSSYEWTFTGGSPSSSTSPNPNVTYATAGSFDVKLKVTNGTGSDSLTQTNYIVVTATPTASISAISDVCVNASAFTLTGGLPSGGIWSGTGVSGNSFNPSTAGVGTHTLTYTAANGSCTDFSTETITVNALPSVSISSLPPICSSSTPFTLGGGTPSGGTYSGTGVSSNIFSPSTAGVGNHLITYTYTNSNGCSSTANTTLTVLPGVSSSLGALSDVCIDASPVLLSGGLPAGGYYTGTGVDTTTGIFDPSIAGVGTHTITYFAVGGLCVTAASQPLTVNPLPTVTLSNIPDACQSSTAAALSGGLPLGGTYSGNYVTNGTFNAVMAGPGMHTIYYTYTDANSCSNLDSSQINVVNSIAYTVADTSVCSDASIFTISSSPAGGVYSGNGVVGNQFDPSVAGVGTHTISYTDPNNTCAISGSGIITVNAVPTVSLAPFPNACLNAGPITLSGGLPIGGVYTGIGVNANVLDPLINGVGTITLTYTVTSNGCSANATQPITIDTGNPEFTNVTREYCENEDAILLTGNPSGGIFSGIGVTGNYFDPSVSGTGSFVLTYSITAGCPGSTQNTFIVNAKPNIPNISGPLTSTQNALTAYNVTSQSGSQYSWVVNGGTITSNSNNQITVTWGSGNSGEVMAIEMDKNGCKDSTDIVVSLWPLTIDDPSAMEFSFYPNPTHNDIQFNGHLNTGGEINISILNLLGQEVFSTSENIDQGNYQRSVDMSRYSTGSYFFQIKLEGEIIQTGQFVKR